MNQLESLVQKLQNASSLQEKLALLSKWDFPHSSHSQMPLKSQYLVKALLAIGQGHVVSLGFDGREEAQAKLTSMLERLSEIDAFYEGIGGLVGYHVTLLRLIQEKGGKSESNKKYLHPAGIDLTQDSQEVRRSVRWGIESLPQLAAIYPVGGAGDRLNLCDEQTQEPLPVAELQFCGHSLLEGLMRDLQALEYLFFKLFGHQEVTPVALMTSEEKNNDSQIRAICARNRWFGRAPESFKFFQQPLVPVITEEGNWALAEPLKLILKPGGHGVVWKLAEEKGGLCLV